VIQQNASASEEMASTTEELSSQAEQLQSSVAYFKVDNSGQQHSAGGRGRSFAAAPKVSHIKHSNQPAGEAQPAPSMRKAKAPGIAIELGGANGDSHDKEFTSY
jgi:methyl-accepting chemotaxis protein